MAVCTECGQQMLEADACAMDEIQISGEWYKRNRDYHDLSSNGRCHDCNVKHGEYHHPGCDMERCPECGEQLLGCDCEVEAYRNSRSSAFK